MPTTHAKNLLDPREPALVQPRPPATVWNIAGVVGAGMLLASIALVTVLIFLVA